MIVHYLFELTRDGIQKVLYCSNKIFDLLSKKISFESMVINEASIIILHIGITIVKMSLFS